MKTLLIGLIGLVLSCVPARATTIFATSTSQTSVQTAINSAKLGDTVQVPSGSDSWSGVNLPAGITLYASGTTINGVVNISLDGTNLSRVTGFNFNSAAQFTFINAYGTGPGLIDHNTFTAGAASEMIHNLGYGADSAAGWSEVVTPGGPSALYIEDNTFTYNISGNPAYFWGTSAVQSYYGARTVFRHNTLHNAQIDQHGTVGMIGARWWEIYDNTFDTGTNSAQCCYIVLRGGSGVVFGNTHTGTNGATGTIELVEEDSGYPALYQIGRGINQSLFPAYVWGNGSDMPVYSGSSNVVQNRDFYLTVPSYSYTPYPYPYVGGTSQPPPPPPPPPSTTPEALDAIPNLSLSGTSGAPLSGSFAISDKSPGWPTYNLASDSPWLTATVSNTQTSSGYVVPVKVNTSGLPLGTSVGHITITVLDQPYSGPTVYHWTNSPYIVTVTVQVSAAAQPTATCTTSSSTSTSLTRSCKITNFSSGQTITYSDKVTHP